MDNLFRDLTDITPRRGFLGRVAGAKRWGSQALQRRCEPTPRRRDRSVQTGPAR
jgi:hypothetical protein